MLKSVAPLIENYKKRPDTKKYRVIFLSKNIFNGTYSKIALIRRTPELLLSSF